MGTIIKQVFSILITVVVIFVGISYLNMKFKGKYQILAKADVINIYATKIKAIDIKDLFTKSERNRITTDYIIVHCDAIDNEIFDHVPLFEIYQYHKKKFKTIGYHYYISKTGKLYQMHNADEVTAHARGYNNIAVSVCLEGNFDKEYLQQDQYNSLIKTLIMLQTKYPKARIIGHCDVSNKTCPGTNIDVNELRNTATNFHIFNLLKHQDNETTK